MNKTEITKIVEKELLEFFDAKTLLRHNKEIMEFSIDATLKAINYSPCCKSDSEQLGLERKAYYAGWTHGDLDMGGNFEKWKKSKT